jgi:hypothetical protein
MNVDASESDFAETPGCETSAELQKAAWLAGADPLPMPKPDDFIRSKTQPLKFMPKSKSEMAATTSVDNEQLNQDNALRPLQEHFDEVKAVQDILDADRARDQEREAEKHAQLRTVDERMRNIESTSSAAQPIY